MCLYFAPLNFESWFRPWIHPINILAALMRKWPLNSAALVAATHRGFGKVADGTCTRVMTCMINRWRVKIDWKEVYNVRDPPRIKDRGRKSRRREKGENCSSLHDLGNLCNLVLKEEEEYWVSWTKLSRTKSHTSTHFLVTQPTPNCV